MYMYNRHPWLRSKSRTSSELFDRNKMDLDKKTASNFRTSDVFGTENNTLSTTTTLMIHVHDLIPYSYSTQIDNSSTTIKDPIN